jgi:hypothetical protein
MRSLVVVVAAKSASDLFVLGHVLIKGLLHRRRLDPKLVSTLSWMFIHIKPIYKLPSQCYFPIRSLSRLYLDPSPTSLPPPVPRISINCPKVGKY